MNDTPIRVERAAMDWLLRVNDPDFDGWDEWQAWLEADPGHGAVYWRLAAREADAVHALAAPVVLPFRKPIRYAPRIAPRWMGLAAAAAVAAVVFGVGGYAWLTRPQPWLLETGPGEERTLALADGTSIQIAGGTRLRLDRRDPRSAELQAGRALFEVAHDDQRPFKIMVGEFEITDLGTVFDVTRLDGGAARIAVSEGLVRVDRNDRSLTLHPGDAVIASAQGFERRNVSLDAVGSWREGRLTYDGERLVVVAADLSRALGEPVTVTPEIEARRFSGSVTVAGAPETLRQRLELLLDADVTHTDTGWRIAGRTAR